MSWPKYAICRLGTSSSESLQILPVYLLWSLIDHTSSLSLRPLSLSLIYLSFKHIEWTPIHLPQSYSHTKAKLASMKLSNIMLLFFMTFTLAACVIQGHKSAVSYFFLSAIPLFFPFLSGFQLSYIISLFSCSFLLYHVKCHSFSKIWLVSQCKRCFSYLNN